MGILIYSSSFAASIHSKLSPSLNFLLATHNDNLAKDQLKDKIPANTQKIDIVVKFDHKLNDAEIAGFEVDGIEFKKFNGKILDNIDCYGMKVDWNIPEVLANRPDVLQIATSWNPKIIPCLDVSNPEIQADQAWTLNDLSGIPLSGEGVLIADFDTGIDVFHPAFFRVTEDTLDWLDVNSDNQFTPGVDAVDLNGNSIAEADELLSFFDGEIRDDAGTFGGTQGVSNNDNLYQPEWDWLYNDADGSGMREFGYWNGYTESDPTYGESMFISIDENQNSTLDIGEKLLPLGESKIQATMNFGDTVRTRGVDLIYSNPDDGGHGTAVSGILAGGHRGVQRFTGIAPEADLLMGYHFYGVEFLSYLPWVREQGCRVLLYEFGGWIFNPLDGSTLDEQLLDYEVSQGVIQVTPSGNLNRGYKHCMTDAAGNSETDIDFIVDIFQGVEPSYAMMSILWRNAGNNLQFSIEDPTGGSTILNCSGGYQNIGNYTFYSDSTTSYRGTREFDMFFYGDNILGTWTITVINNSSEVTEVNGYISDDASAWEGGAEFIDYRSNMKTVCSPATADSAFVLGSYSTRGYEQYIGVGSGSMQIGQLSFFSSRGPRIDDVSILSVISPGNYDIYSSRFRDDFPGTFGGWRQFSGTSSAGPHVAASLALIVQGNPDFSVPEMAGLLEQTAFKDQWTGSTYTDSTGHGKIRIYDALYNAGIIDHEQGQMPGEFSLKSFPNPFNAEAKINFHLPISGKTKVMVYDVLGREIEILHDGWLPAGDNHCSFDGKNLTSGIYFVKVKSGKYSGIDKLVLLK